MDRSWWRVLTKCSPLEKEMAIHSSTVVWKIPWTEEPDRLQSMGLRNPCDQVDSFSVIVVSVCLPSDGEG